MKNLLYILLLINICAFGQTTTQNYVKTLTYKTATTASDATKANTSVTYFDGLGRPIQQIAGKASGTGGDVVTHIQYDQYGRQSAEYLPYPSTATTLAYNTSVKTLTQQYYNTAAFENTQNPYSKNFYEASPLNRVRKEAAPGTAWMGNDANDNDHTVKYAYKTNTATEVKRLTATATVAGQDMPYTVSFNNLGNYGAGELYKTITQNENYASSIDPVAFSVVGAEIYTTVEYKNKEGQLVLKRSYVMASGQFAFGSVALDTYYVYDQFGNLSYVLPPLASGVFSEDICYQYKYDYRNRLIEKRLPGKQWEFIVYDSQDRVIATGPAFSPFGTGEIGWMYNKYETFNRLAIVGWYPATVSSANRTALQATATYTGTVMRGNMYSLDQVLIDYNFGTSMTTTTSTNIVTPVYNDVPVGFKLLNVYYYDTYGYPSGPSAPSNLTIEAQTALVNTTGLATGTWTRVVTTPTETLNELAYTYYDSESRPISNYSTNYLGGYTQIDTNLDFDGTTIYTIKKHKRLDTDTELTVRDNFTYTAQDRLSTQSNSIAGATAKQLLSNTYNALGQLTVKRVGGTTSVPLQKIDFSYNIRGWLKGINDVSNLTPTITTTYFRFDPVTGLGTPVNIISADLPDLFAHKINYNDAIQHTSGLNVSPLYNGNIAETSWRSINDNVQRRYGYGYDPLNRLTDAWYEMPEVSVVPIRKSYDEHITYDTNGNILTLKRNGGTDIDTGVTLTDNLTYTYNATKKNQLEKVADAAANTNGFKDGTNTDNDYTYDVNGNMLTDKNKNLVTNITYNHLNQPVNVTFSGTTSIKYTYNASGEKVAKVAKIPTSTTTDYLDGGFQYQNGVLQFFPTAEGYVRRETAGTYTYVYQYKDHLGNTRLTYCDSDNNGYINDTQLLQDGFESQSGWSDGLTYDTTRKHTGSYAGKIANTATTEKLAFSDARFSINNTVATNYTFSCWVYSDGPSAELFLYMKTSESATDLTTSQVATSVTGIWTPITKTISIPAGIKSIQFRLDNNGTGNVWFDDVQIKRSSSNTEIVQEDNYYPFGLKHSGYNTIASSSNPAQKYKYQGQELQDESVGGVQLGWYAFKWRNYNPEIARFMSIDPLTEEYEDYTPYQFSSNQPVHACELEGLENVADRSKRIELRQSFPTRNDAIRSSNQMARTVQLARSAPASRQASTAPRATISQGLSSSQYKQNEAKAASIAIAKQTVANHDNLGSPYTQNSVMVGAAYGAADVVTGEVIGKAVGGISKLMGGNSTSVFRAVSAAELTDIGENGLRTTAGGYETSKLFTTSAENAAEFGRLNYSWDKIPNTIIEAKVPSSVMKTTTPFTADGMNAIAIPAEQLQNIKRITPLNSSPIK